MAGTRCRFRFGQFDRSPPDGRSTAADFSRSAPRTRRRRATGLPSRSRRACWRRRRSQADRDCSWHRRRAYPAFQNRGPGSPSSTRAPTTISRTGAASSSSPAALPGPTASSTPGLGPLDIQTRVDVQVRPHDLHARQAEGAGLRQRAQRRGAAAAADTASTAGRADFRFENQAYDVEVSNVNVLGTRHVVSYGGNFRHNKFDLSLAPGGHQPRRRRRLRPGRNLPLGSVSGGSSARGSTGSACWTRAVFSPRTRFSSSRGREQTIRLSFNRAFRAPSFVNNYIDLKFWVPLMTAVPAAGRSPKETATSRRNRSPPTRPAYAGAFGRGHGWRRSLPERRARPDLIHPGDAPRAAAAAAVHLSQFRSGVTRGFELSLDGRINEAVTGFVNYTLAGRAGADRLRHQGAQYRAAASRQPGRQLQPGPLFGQGLGQLSERERSGRTCSTFAITAGPSRTRCSTPCRDPFGRRRDDGSDARDEPLNRSSSSTCSGTSSNGHDREKCVRILTAPLSDCPACGSPLRPASSTGRIVPCLFARTGAGQAEDQDRRAEGLGAERRSDDLLAPGATFGRFEIVGVLGRGGMAHVYEAREAPPLERTVALKVLPPEFLHNESFAARFAAGSAGSSPVSSIRTSFRSMRAASTTASPG